MSTETLLAYLVTHLRCFLAGVFLLSSIAKARNLPEFVTTVRLFRLAPERLSYALAHIIVILELAISVCLLVGIWSQWAAGMAAVMLITFIIAMLINMIRRNILNCNCFGPYFKEQIGVKAILRNVLLLTLALIVVIFYDGFFALEFLLRDGEGATPSHPVAPFMLLTTLTGLIAIITLAIRQFIATSKLMRAKGDSVDILWLASHGALWMIVIIQAVLLLALARQIGLLYERVGIGGARIMNAGPAIGQIAPKLDTADVNGQRVTLGIERNKRTLLLFISTGCATCAALMPRLKRLAYDERDNGPRFSRREASAASEAVGWKRVLGGILHFTKNQVAYPMHQKTNF
ncbi:MAG: hypothetical protein KatS3mg053_0444 [Candidatus Roseilinea sp.]|nr:MAG: hypothetical protein KatS3mg053_0444 [Candidatus Roseilinea sp.]